MKQILARLPKPHKPQPKTQASPLAMPKEIRFSSLGWLIEQGLAENGLHGLIPCLPGEFTMQNAFYVNSATPNVLYRGTEEGTLPLVPGRWYLLPTLVASRLTHLAGDALSVAAAVRLSRHPAAPTQ